MTRVLSSCIERYWDIAEGVLIERNRADLARLRNCFWDLRDFSQSYADYAFRDLPGRAVELEAALQSHLGATPTRQHSQPSQGTTGATAS